MYVIDTALDGVEITEDNLADLFERGVKSHGLVLLASLKITFWRECRFGRSFALSTPDLARQGLVEGWNRDLYWRTIRNLLKSGDLVKVTDTQPRQGHSGRFAACRYRFGTMNFFARVETDTDSVWFDGDLQEAHQWMN